MQKFIQNGGRAGTSPKVKIEAARPSPSESPKARPSHPDTARLEWVFQEYNLGKFGNREAIDKARD